MRGSSPCTYILSKEEKLMRDLLWEGNDKMGAAHLVAWEVIFCPTEKEGLGVGNLALRNKALIIKWLWRFPLEENSLCHSVIESNGSLEWLLERPLESLGSFFLHFLMTSQYFTM